jgi:hypothetical protein
MLKLQMLTNSTLQLSLSVLLFLKDSKKYVTIVSAVTMHQTIKVPLVANSPFYVDCILLKEDNISSLGCWHEINTFTLASR